MRGLQRLVHRVEVGVHALLRHDDALLDGGVVLERGVEKREGFCHVGEDEFLAKGLRGGYNCEEFLEQRGLDGHGDGLLERQHALHRLHQLHEVLDLPRVVLLVLVVQRAVVGVLRVDHSAAVVVQAREHALDVQQALEGRRDGGDERRVRDEFGDGVETSRVERRAWAYSLISLML